LVQSYPGLPDGIKMMHIKNPIHISHNLEMEIVSIFYGRLEYFTVIWYMV
jgi:hypothetical protein